MRDPLLHQRERVPGDELEQVVLAGRVQLVEHRVHLLDGARVARGDRPGVRPGQRRGRGGGFRLSRERGARAARPPVRIGGAARTRDTAAQRPRVPGLVRVLGPARGDDPLDAHPRRPPAPATLRQESSGFGRPRRTTGSGREARTCRSRSESRKALTSSADARHSRPRSRNAFGIAPLAHNSLAVDGDRSSIFAIAGTSSSSASGASAATPIRCLIQPTSTIVVAGRCSIASVSACRRASVLFVVGSMEGGYARSPVGF